MLFRIVDLPPKWHSLCLLFCFVFNIDHKTTYMFNGKQFKLGNVCVDIDLVTNLKLKHRYSHH